MTSVIGHLNGVEFEPNYRKWGSCAPEHLFDVQVIETVDEVHMLSWMFERLQRLTP